MNKSRRNIIRLSGVMAIALGIGGCGNDDTSRTVGDLRTWLYPSGDLIAYDIDKVVLKFNMPIDPQSLKSNITLADQNGTLDGLFNVMLDNEDVSSRTVMIVLNDYSFRPSWRYRIAVGTAVKSTTGEAFRHTQYLSFVTTSHSPFETPASNAKRTKIAVISDLHLNQQLAADEGYGLFTENGTLLTQFLANIKSSAEIKELIILGDLMDMWVVPMAYDTLDNDTQDIMGYFQSVANAAVNKEIINMLNAIADEGLIQVTYVPGNHDMTLSEDIFYTIFPNAVWKGGAEGTGVYYPETGIACEHGHNYDIFNAPDTLTTAESILPPGYFIARIFATKNLTTQTTPPTIQNRSNTQKMEYTAAFDMAVNVIGIPGLNPDTPQIVTGVDGYTRTISVNEARDIFSPTIGSDWQLRQVNNGVYQPASFEKSLLNAGTLFGFATTQYFLPQRARIAVFGHTHQAMIHKHIWKAEKIYANSGTWIDDKRISSDALGRTCVVINSAVSSGSEVDTVTVYQCQADGTLRNVGEANIST